MYIRYVDVTLVCTLYMFAVTAVCRVHTKTCFITAGVYLVGHHKAPSLHLVGCPGVLSILPNLTTQVRRCGVYSASWKAKPQTVILQVFAPLDWLMWPFWKKAPPQICFTVKLNPVLTLSEIDNNNMRNFQFVLTCLVLYVVCWIFVRHSPFSREWWDMTEPLSLVTFRGQHQIFNKITVT